MVLPPQIFFIWASPQGYNSPKRIGKGEKKEKEEKISGEWDFWK